MTLRAVELAFTTCALFACTGPSSADAALDAVDVATDASDATDAMSPVARHSGSIAISPDGAHVYVVNADGDSISIVDTASRMVEHEVLLTSAPPSVSPTTGRFDPSVEPRALALSPHANKLYVTGERAGSVFVVDLATATVVDQIAVGSEPIGVLVSPDESSVYVACEADATVVRIDVASRSVVATAQTMFKPWALAWASDASALYVSHLLGSVSDLAHPMNPNVSVLDRTTLAITATWSIPDAMPTMNPLVANGQVRALYDLAVRPGTDELWFTHLLLATSTEQTPTTGMMNALVFNTTVFPAMSVLNTSDGSFTTRLTSGVMGEPGSGQIGDVVSGPHAIAFMPDGMNALVVDTNSEDVMIVDATNHVQYDLVHPLGAGHMPEGIVISPDGAHAYVDTRNTHDIVALAITTNTFGLSVSVDGTPIERVVNDPMGNGTDLRTGQLVFFSANSTQLQTTTNSWVACANCHVEGRSDAITWRFTPGPRDTPSNAGGVAHTGFLLHTADRQHVSDYWRTIQVEQGGTLSPTVMGGPELLAALQDFVNFAIPYPVPPQTDPVAVAHGQQIFNDPAVGCASCHTGEYFTDSGAGNPSLDFGGIVLLHPVGTCNMTTDYPDVAHMADNGDPRMACMFDTPTLRGIADSAPYFHDGSAATLLDALEMTRGTMGNITGLSSSDLSDLVEYLRSL